MNELIVFLKDIKNGKYNDYNEKTLNYILNRYVIINLLTEHEYKPYIKEFLTQYVNDILNILYENNIIEEYDFNINDNEINLIFKLCKFNFTITLFLDIDKMIEYCNEFFKNRIIEMKLIVQ